MICLFVHVNFRAKNNLCIPSERLHVQVTLEAIGNDIFTLYQTNKILDLSKIKSSADHKLTVAEVTNVFFRKDTKYCRKRRKRCLSPFHPFLTIVFKK